MGIEGIFKKISKAHKFKSIMNIRGDALLFFGKM
jgi:hypothetical protein